MGHIPQNTSRLATGSRTPLHLLSHITGPCSMRRSRSHVHKMYRHITNSYGAISPVECFGLPRHVEYTKPPRQHNPTTGIIIMTTKGSHNKKFRLNTGASIPAIGFGTWKSKPDDAYESVRTALQTGYRHIDTAFVSFPPLS